MSQTVLFVDDEPEITEGLKRTLRKEPYDVITANSANEALELLKKGGVDVVISDEKMPGMTGTEFLARVRNKYPETIRMVLTGQASLEAAIHAINKGQIYRFLTKPCNDMDLAFTIQQALRQKQLVKKANQLLRISRRQAAIIQRMENDHPEILKVERDREGAIMIDESERDLDPDDLIRELIAVTGKIHP